MVGFTESDRKGRMLTEARQASRKTKREFMKRQKIIAEKRHIALVKKQELEKKKATTLKEKQKLTDKIVYYGQSSHEVTSKVEELVGKEKLDAQQAQIRFIQKVLKKNHADNFVFAFSAKDDRGKYKKHLVEKLTENLIHLVLTALQELQSHASKKVIFLVGNRVSHKFVSGEWVGRVISTIPGFMQWYNIKYNHDDAVYTYKLLEDLNASDLRILAEVPDPSNWQEHGD